MATISPSSIAPEQLPNVLRDQQSNANSLSATATVKAGIKPSSMEDSLKRFRTTLLQKIGKVGDAPSKTGLNLHDAEAIDAFVIANMVKWRQALNEHYANQFNSRGSSNPILLITKKSKENDLPRTLLVGFHKILGGYRTGVDGAPYMRVIVLCKRKVSATEHPDEKVAKAAKPTDPVMKVKAVGEGAFRIVKAALDWLSGEMLVEILSRKPKVPSDLTGKVINELKILGRLAGCQNIVQDPFMIRLLANNTRYSYLMHRYKGTLAMELKSAHPMLLKDVIMWMKNLSGGLCGMNGRHILHNDAKTDNVLVDEDSSLKFADFDVSCSLDRYNTNVKNKKMPAGTPRYFAPELWHAMLERDLTTALLPVAPFGKDIWATGWVFAEILAGKCFASSKSFEDFHTQMDEIGKKVYDIYKKKEKRNGFSFSNSAIDDLVTKFIGELKAEVENDTSRDDKEKEIVRKLTDITRDMLQVNVANRLTAEQLNARLNVLNG